MQYLKIIYIFNLFVAVSFASCSKQPPKDNRSTALKLLQSHWNHISTTSYQKNGTTINHVTPSSPVLYYFNTDNYLYVNPTVPTPTNIIYHIYYQLQKDDTTLVFINDGSVPVEYDTFYITTISSQCLVYHGQNQQRTFNTIDSLIK